MKVLPPTLVRVEILTHDSRVVRRIEGELGALHKWGAGSVTNIVDLRVYSAREIDLADLERRKAKASAIKAAPKGGGL